MDCEEKLNAIYNAVYNSDGTSKIEEIKNVVNDNKTILQKFKELVGLI
mgnify:FL=1|jgi:hypothetical protein